MNSIATHRITCQSCGYGWEPTNETGRDGQFIDTLRTFCSVCGAKNVVTAQLKKPNPIISKVLPAKKTVEKAPDTAKDTKKEGD